MATVTHDFDALAGYTSGTIIPDVVAGQAGQKGAFGRRLVANAAGAELTFRFHAVDYATGNMTVTIHWYNDVSSATGNVTLEAMLSSQQPNVSLESAIAPTPGAVASVTTAVSSTTLAPQSSVITLTSLDGAAAGYPCYLTIRRNDANTSPTCSVTSVTLSYSDGTSSAVGPASSVAGNLASFADASGGTLADSGIAAANVNTTVTAGAANEIAVFSGTGKALLAGGTTIGSVVKNTGPSVVSDNLVKFSGTSGLNVLDSGIALTSVAQTASAKSAGDVLWWNGSVWVPKFNQTKAITTDFVVPGTTLGDVTGLSFAIPRAGSYHIVMSILYTNSAASTNAYALNFTGTLTAIRFSSIVSATGTTAVYVGTNANNTAATFAVTAAFTVPGIATVSGGLVATSSGTLTFRAQRSAATFTILAGSAITVSEV